LIFKFLKFSFSRNTIFAKNSISKERASNNLVNFKTRPARLKQNLAGQEQRPNWILTWQVFFLPGLV